MARTVNDSRYPAYLPRNWRVMTAAGVTTMGLACGLVQPALAEWWKQSKPESQAAMTSATAGRTGSTENGFAATIRRLLAESRRAAEQGDHAKAMQLAERAAKISEAASQVVGPAAECSPQETARFLAEMRTRSSGPAAVVAAQPTEPAAPLSQISAPAETKKSVAAAPTSPPVRKPATVPAVPPSRMAAAPPLPAALLPRPAQTTPQPPEPKRLADAVEPSAVPAHVEATPSQSPSPQRSAAVSASATITRSNSHPPLQRVPMAEKPVVAKAAGTKIPPSPSNAPAKTDVNSTTSAPAKTGSSALTKSGELLAQSRLAAADGRLERAIELAEQAVEASRGPALFGPVLSNTSSDEATRWRNKLLTQQLSSQREVPRESKVEIFEPPLKVASVRRRAPALPIADERDPFADELHQPLPAGASTAVDDETADGAVDLKSGPVSTATPVPQASSVPQSLVASATNPNPQDDPLWSEELPPTPAPQSRHEREPIKFSRSVISRSGGWVDADWNDAASEESARPSTESRTPIESRTNSESRATTESNASSTETLPPSDLRASADGVDPAHTTASGELIEPAIESTIEPTATVPFDHTSKPDTAFTSQPAVAQPRDDFDRAVGEVDTVNEVASETATEKGNSAPTDTVTDTVSETMTDVAITEASGQVPARSALRLRGGIQQVAGEFPFPNSESPRLPDEETAIQTIDGPSSPKTTERTPTAKTEWAADATDEAGATELPVQRFPVQRVIQLRRRMESASSLNPGGWSAEPSQPPTADRRKTEPLQETKHTEVPVEPDVKSAAPIGSEWHAQEPPVNQSPAVAGQRAPVKLRERSRLRIDDPADGGSQTASMVPKPPGQPRQPAIGHSQATLWQPVDSTTTRTTNSAVSAANGPESSVVPSINNSSRGSAKQPRLIPPISQVGFESTPTSSVPDLTERAGHVPTGSTNADAAPPPPAISDDEPWYVDETQKERKPSGSDAVIRKSSFAMIDRLAETCQLPVSTVISLVCGGGLALIVGGLLALRVALRRRHS